MTLVIQIKKKNFYYIIYSIKVFSPDSLKGYATVYKYC